MVVDATAATPVHLRPLEHGADFVLHSATKYLGGHDDVLLGVVVCKREEDAARLKEFRLLSHPRQLADAKDPRYQWGPLPPVNPVVQIELSSGTIKAELFEDEAPNAVAAFIKLAGQKYFDGLKWEPIGVNERLNFNQPSASATSKIR